MVTYRLTEPDNSTFNATTWYRLTNISLPNFAFDVINNDQTATHGAVNMAATGNYSGQYWQLNPLSPNRTDGNSQNDVYAINCMYQGRDRRLEIPTTAFPGGGLRPRLSIRTDTPVWGLKQEWRIEPVEGQDGVFTITNMALPLKLGIREGSLFRDIWLVSEDGDVGEGEAGGKLETGWRIEPAMQIQDPQFLVRARDELPRRAEESLGGIRGTGN